MELSTDQSISEERAAAIHRASDPVLLTAKRAGDLQVGDLVAVAGNVPGLRIRSIRVGAKIIINVHSRGGIFESNRTSSFACSKTRAESADSD
jgi:hypothetical protein